MKIGFIGLGRMGGRMVSLLLEKKHKVVLYARHPKSMNPFIKKSAIGTKSFEEFSKKLGKEKIALLMVPHGNPTDEVIAGIEPFFSKGDIIIDGGNSYYKDSIERGKTLAKKGIYFLDVGTSGGLLGAMNGASIMVGGNKKAFKKAEPIFKSLAMKNGYEYMGHSGAGHFVKMVHNGIEYAWLQSLGEGFRILEKSDYNLDLRKVTKIYKNGSVIRSWLMDLLYDAMQKDPKLKKQSGVVGGGSTGNWTLKTAKEMNLAFETLEVAMNAREKSFKNPDFSGKVVAALRFGFGGHIPPKK